MKRGRLDVGISKEDYYNREDDSVNEVGNGIRTGNKSQWASPQALKNRKILTTSRDHEFTRHVAALNTAFAASIKDQWHHNKNGVWIDNMKEYLQYMHVIKARFGKETGKLLTFGSGDCGQLGHGVDEDDDLMVRYPRILDRLSMRKVTNVACGGLHSAAVTYDGLVFTWGCSDDGALGREGDENYPLQVVLPPSRNNSPSIAVQLAAGDSHTVAVTSAGEVFTWGCYKDKEGKQWCDAKDSSSVFKAKQLHPFRISQLTNVVDVQSGACHNLARTNMGHVYSWGLGEIGQLGRPIDINLRPSPDASYEIERVFEQHLTPKKIVAPKNNDGKNRYVKAIGCGSYHSLISVEGVLYTCGLNNYGQLGIGSTDNKESLTLVDDLKMENIVQCDGGTHHSAVLTTKGSVFTFGRADSGQTGTMDICNAGDFKDTPQLVNFPDQELIQTIACGSNHNLSLSENSKSIYAWGFGDMLALGTGHEADENRPIRIDWSKKVSSLGTTPEVLQIVCGGQHSAIIAKQ